MFKIYLFSSHSKSIRAEITGFMLLLFSLLMAEAHSQQKRDLTAQDYKLWTTMYGGTNSEDGSWVSYHVKQQEKDTLYLKSSATGILYTYPEATSENFSRDSKWFGFITGDSLNLLNLQSGKQQTFAGVSVFSFAGSRYLLGYSTPTKTLWLKDLESFATVTFPNVRRHVLNADQTLLGLISEETGLNTVRIIALKPGFAATVLATEKVNTYTSLTWNKPGTGLAFYEMMTDGQNKPIVQKVYVCRNLTGKPSVKVLDPMTAPGFPANRELTAERLYLSDNSEQLFLDLHVKSEKSNTAAPTGEEKSDVQIWLPSDQQVPPAKDRTAQIQWYVWWVEQGKILAVETLEYPHAVLTGDNKKALVYHKRGYLPLYKYGGDYMDIYIRDLFTGDTRLLVKALHEFGHVLVSPGGKYVTYFKDKHWWIYDIQSDLHKSLTQGMDITFENTGNDRAGDKPPYGNPGWLEDDSQVILYDQFDIWLMTPGGGNKVRITNGRESNTNYRIYRGGAYSILKSSFFGFVADAYNNKGFLVTSLNNKTLDQGFCYWDKKSGLKKVVEKARKIYPEMKPDGKQVVDVAKPFVFVETDFDVSPRLILLYPSGKEQLIYQSNPQQQHFHWGKSKLINFSTADGKQLKGALFYPANYDPAKKYPMIVSIYERKADLLHDYDAPWEESPGGFNSIGFNTTSYTVDGYFVLYPDIAYKMNEPGISAAQCVIAATKKVIDMGVVDKDRIGLTGFSFGAYETSFIISQTNLFKTAVAGGGYHDPVDYYLGFSSSGQNMWRFETQQQRMQVPFYGEEFRRNSTLMNANKINTPLLLWTGDKDGQVDWTQSRKLHIALWRLGKESTLLIYPGEPHGVYKEVNQKDITVRTKNWFDHYLKGEKPAAWMAGEKTISISAFSQDPDAQEFAKLITAEDAKRHLSILASDAYEGRETGTPGGEKAANYLAEQFKKIGLEAPVQGSYFQRIPMLQNTSEVGKYSLSVNGTPLSYGNDYYFSGITDTKTIEANEIVFIPYLGDVEDINLKNTDLTGNVVMYITSYKIDQTKSIQYIQSKNPALIISVDQDLATVLKTSGESMRKINSWLVVKKESAAKEAPILSIPPSVAELFFKKAGKSYEELAKDDSLDPHIIKTTFSTTFGLESKDVFAANVLGFLSGSDLKEEVLVFSAHYDHIGLTKGGADKVNNGADDDASGTTGVLEIARAFAEAKKAGKGPRRSILFLAFTAEEKGLLGSKWYTDHPVFSLEKTIADLNIDMIGRTGYEYIEKADSVNYCYLIGSDRLSTDLHRISENANAAYTKLKIDYKYNAPEDPEMFYRRSDHYNFAKHGIPVIFYFNGVHGDYHQPGDEVSKINFPLLAKRTQLVYFTGWDLANRGKRPAVDAKNAFSLEK